MDARTVGESKRYIAAGADDHAAMAADFLGAVIVLPVVICLAGPTEGLAAAVNANKLRPAGGDTGAGLGGLRDIMVSTLRIGAGLGIITPAAGQNALTGPITSSFFQNGFLQIVDIVNRQYLGHKFDTA